MTPFTPADWARARWDVVFFAWRMLGIKLHPGQKRMVNAYLQRTKSGWRALFLWLFIAAGNRAGKTLCLAIIILHAALFKMSVKPPSNDPVEIERWGALPFHWWHFAVEQAPAEQVFWEIATLLGGIHPAQKDGCPWANLVGGAEKIATMADTGLGYDWCKGSKERGEYAWIILAPDLGGAQIHFRSTKAKALSGIGQNMHGLSFDEAGLEPNLEWLVREILNARRLGTGGQFILIGTASAATSADFEDFWITGDPEDPFHDERRFSMSMSTRDNIGYGIDKESFNALVDGMDEDWIAQNIDGKFIQAVTAWFNSGSVLAAFKEELPEEEPPVKGGVYIHVLDPGLKDKTWSLVFRVLADGRMRGVSIERITGKQTTRGIVALGIRNHERYALGGKAFVDTGVDTTALGGHMFRDLLEERITVKSIEFGGNSKVKRLLLSDARSALDEARIEMPASGLWAEVRKQLRNYKLLDRKIEQDLVMEVAMATKLLRQAPRPGVAVETKFDYGVEEPKKGPPDGITPTSLRAKMAEKRLRQRALTEQSSGLHTSSDG